MKTNSGLVEYCKCQIGLPYWYGTFGQIATSSLYEYNKKRLPDYYLAENFKSQYGKRIHDCIGLIKGYIWSDSPTAKPVYNASQDVGAQRMYSISNTKGKMSSFPKHSGMLVYKGSNTLDIFHVGVYIGNNKVIEAKSHTYGVIESDLNSYWKYWSQCPFIHDDYNSNSNDVKNVEEVAQDVILGKYGNGSERRKKLESEGYDYNKVQDYVTKLLNVTYQTKIELIANDVIRGKYGNGEYRKKLIESLGYSYADVQAKVNQLLT